MIGSSLLSLLFNVFVDDNGSIAVLDVSISDIDDDDDISPFDFENNGRIVLLVWLVVVGNLWSSYHDLVMMVVVVVIVIVVDHDKMIFGMYRILI